MRILNGNGFQGQRLLQDAGSSGFLDAQTITADAANGTVVAVLGKGVGDALGAAVNRMFGSQPSIGGPPVIKFHGKQAYIEISGRPGLQLERSQLDQLILSAAAGSAEQLQSIFEELFGQSIPDWTQQPSQQPQPAP